MAKTKSAKVLTKLTEAEQDLVSHMENGWQLQTDSLGGDPILRGVKGKDDEVIRPTSANRNTVKALEDRSLIVPGKAHDPLKIVWRMKNK